MRDFFGDQILGEVFSFNKNGQQIISHLSGSFFKQK